MREALNDYLSVLAVCWACRDGLCFECDARFSEADCTCDCPWLWIVDLPTP